MSQRTAVQPPLFAARNICSCRRSQGHPSGAAGRNEAFSCSGPVKVWGRDKSAAKDVRHPAPSSGSQTATDPRISAWLKALSQDTKELIKSKCFVEGRAQGQDTHDLGGSSNCSADHNRAIIRRAFLVASLKIHVTITQF
jgi:hypothetical protein